MQKQILRKIAKEFSKKNFSKHNPKEAKNLPPLLFFSNRQQFKNIFAAVKEMPDFIGIIIREYDLNYQERLEFAKKIKDAAGRKIILVGKNLDIALAIKADGVHFSDHDQNYNFYNYQKIAKNLLITYSCHSPCFITKAQKNNFDAIFYSPIFPTESHTKSTIIGIRNLIKITQQNKIPIYALGGINQKNYQLLMKTKISGIGGISMFKSFDYQAT